MLTDEQLKKDLKTTADLIKTLKGEPVSLAELQRALLTLCEMQHKVISNVLGLH